MADLIPLADIDPKLVEELLDRAFEPGRQKRTAYRIREGMEWLPGLSFAAVDANQASAAELDSIKGIGPAISTKILDERKKGNFKDWNDFISRVNGLGEKNAAKFSAQGMTINGSAYSGAPAPAPAPKAEGAAKK